MATIVVAHGAWSSAWAWQKMRPLLREAGHELYTPSYTGLGERGHLASPAIDLDTHIADVLGVLKFEDLNDVVLIGHSYGGMVATGVADRSEGRVAKLIYLDAFAPKDGQSLFDLVGPETELKMRQGASETGAGWKVPANPMPPDTPPDYVAWADAAQARRSRSSASSRSSGCRRGRCQSAATSIARASRRMTFSDNLRRAPRPRAGATPKWTRATIRISRCRSRCGMCCRG